MLPMPTISAIQIGLEAVNGTEEKARSKPDGRNMKANPVVMPRAARFDSVDDVKYQPSPSRNRAAKDLGAQAAQLCPVKCSTSRRRTRSEHSLLHNRPFRRG